MNIQTVKLQSSGYLVNGKLSVPIAEGNRHYQQVQDWLLTNTPDPEFTPREIARNNARRARQGRMSQIDDLIVTTVSGKVFNADKNARSALTTAVVLGEAGTSTSWKMEDDTVEVITWEELKEALVLLDAAQTALIAVED